MSRNRAFIPVVGAVAALLVASVAIAAVKTTKASVTSVSSTFTASTVSHVHNQTCSAKGGDSFQSTTAVYKGTSTSEDARLSGPITIKAHSFLDTTSGLGTITGTFAIKGTGKARATGALSGVLSNGTLSGWVKGGTAGPAGALLASLGGSFGQTSGFTVAGIGSANTGAGVVVKNASCTAPKKK